jgi:hypothetical protein
VSRALQIGDLLDELDGRENHVRVSVYRAKTVRGLRVVRKRVLDELNPAKAVGVPSLVLADTVRMLRGAAPVYLAEATRRLGGELVSVTPNLRTNVGINFCAANLWGTDGGQVAIADYIAISNNNAAPASTDSSSTAPWSTAAATDAAPSGSRGEWTALGLTRKQATLAHTANATSLTASATWTASGTATSSQMAGLFGGSSKTTQGAVAGNILFLENTFTATTLNTSDQLSLTWTLTF